MMTDHIVTVPLVAFYTYSIPSCPSSEKEVLQNPVTQWKQTLENRCLYLGELQGVITFF